MQVFCFDPGTTETTELDVFVNFRHFLHTFRVKKVVDCTFIPLYS